MNCTSFSDFERKITDAYIYSVDTNLSVLPKAQIDLFSCTLIPTTNNLINNHLLHTLTSDQMFVLKSGINFSQTCSP